MREIKFRAWDTIVEKMLSMKEIEQSGMNLFALCEGSKLVKLMQYTGLKDKNGKEIYDQDILRDQYDSLYTVIYEYGCFKLLWNHKTEIKQTFYNDEFSECILEQSQYEVIGNIYENPELVVIES